MTVVVAAFSVLIGLWAPSKPLFSLGSVPAVKVYEVCPDCPTHIGMDNSEVQKTVTLSLEKFNKESGLSKHFSLLKVTRAVSGVSFVPATKCLPQQ